MHSYARTSLIAAIVVVGLSGIQACGSTSSEATSETIGTSEDEVARGVPEDGYRSVGIISDAKGICTGTLIAPDVVLSAAHCVVSYAGKEIFFPTTNSTPNPARQLCKHFKMQRSFQSQRP